MKLDNILLKQVEPFIWIKLCDFGTSRSTDDNLKSFAGTRLTLDPSVNDNNYDENADIHSIGCMLYFLLYGKYPCQESYQVYNPNPFHDMIKEKKYDFPKITDEYDEVIECCKELLKYNDNEMNWSIFKKQPYVKRCVKEVRTFFAEQ